MGQHEDRSGAGGGWWWGLGKGKSTAAAMFLFAGKNEEGEAVTAALRMDLLEG